MWSTTKGPTALCAHLLADRGLLDLDAPVATYWPEFAASGKESIPVRHLLSHRAGLARLREPRTLDQFYDWELTTARLAATEPWWEPGTRSGYHAITYGFLVGEVVRRGSPDSCRGVSAPGDHRPARHRLHHRAAGEGGGARRRTGPSAGRGEDEQAAIFAQLQPVALAALVNPVIGAAEANTPAWRAAEIPAANGHGTAGAVAALYGILAGRGEFAGRRVLSPGAAERVREGQGSCRAWYSARASRVTRRWRSASG